MTRRSFQQLTQGDYLAVLKNASPRVRHVFGGRHPLGGERHGRDAFRAWFERLFRLFPRLEFEVLDVVVRGWPWRTTVTVEWRAQVTPAFGPSYVNEAAHVIHLRWGRAVYVHAYEDSQAVAEACRLMADRGVEEASADPIITTA